MTNVPGPQFPLYLLGRRLAQIYPKVPVPQNCALGIAIMSYDGRIDFGLTGDYDALPDLDALATRAGGGDQRAGRRGRAGAAPKRRRRARA